MLGDSGGQGSLACCSPRGGKESDMTWRLNSYKYQKTNKQKIHRVSVKT